jgi:uncharacterized membrane protein
MSKIEKPIEIKATPEKVFNYIKDLEKQPDWMASIKSHKITSERKEGVGITTHCVTEPAGRRMEYDSEVTEWEENRRLAWECRPPMKNKGSFTLEPIDDGTRVLFEMEYELPYWLLGIIIDKIKVRKEIQESISKDLENLKDILER